MKRRFELGTLLGVRITAGWQAGAGVVGLWILAAVAARTLLDIPWGEALLGGLACALIQEFSEIAHQMGHAWAARRVGYPMQRLHLWWILGTSLYPRDEPELPAEIHIRRALGGPAASLLLTAAAGVIALALRPWDETPGWIAAFAFLDNLLVFTLGAFLPLGFTDGSTLLEWWPKRGKPAQK